MTSLLPALHRASFNDIIFEGRNKAYGAYELRLIYPSHLKRAVAAMLVLCAGLIVGPRVLAYLQPAAEVVAPPKASPVDEDKERVFTPVPDFAPPKAPVVPKPKITVATQQHVQPVIVPDRAPVAEAKLTTMEEANAAQNLGAQTTEGANVAAPLEVVAAPAAAAGGGQEVAVEYSEVMPTFPGGMKALLKFLGDNMKYPPQALRNGIEGKVYIKFVVDATGQVVNPVLVRGIGGGCDEEALRVVRLLPLFKPGEQNGRPVKVYYNVPIAFKIR